MPQGQRLEETYYHIWSPYGREVKIYNTEVKNFYDSYVGNDLEKHLATREYILNRVKGVLYDDFVRQDVDFDPATGRITESTIYNSEE